MNRYVVKFKVSTALSFFTQADHFGEFEIKTLESLEILAKRLAKEGFSLNATTWVMPGAITEIKKCKKA